MNLNFYLSPLFSFFFGGGGREGVLNVLRTLKAAQVSQGGKTSCPKADEFSFLISKFRLQVCWRAGSCPLASGRQEGRLYAEWRDSTLLPVSAICLNFKHTPLLSYYGPNVDSYFCSKTNFEDFLFCFIFHMTLCNITSLFILELLHLVSISVSMWQLSRLLNVFPFILSFIQQISYFLIG